MLRTRASALRARNSPIPSPPELFRHGGGHAGLGDDALHLFRLAQHHQIAGAAGDELLKAALGVVAGVDGGGGGAHQGSDVGNHVAVEADVRDGNRARVAACVVHHDQGVHVVALHLAHTLVGAAVEGDGVDAGAHEVGGGQRLMRGRVDKLAQEILNEAAGGVGQHLLRRGHLDDPAVIHENDHIGQIQRLLHVVGNKHKGLVQLLLEGAHLLLEGAPGHGVQGGEGLVHQHDGGRGRQGTENTDALLLSAGHLGGVLVGVLLIGQVDQLQQLMDDLVARLLAVFQQIGHHADVLGHGHVGKQADLLDDIANVAAQLHPVLGGDILAVYIDLAAGGFNQAVDHLQRGGLAAAGRADQDRHLPLLDFKGDVVDNFLTPVGERNVFKTKQSGSPLFPV